MIKDSFPTNRLSRPAFPILFFRHLLWTIRGFISPEITIPTRQGLITMSSKDQGLAARMYRHRQHEFDLSLLSIDFLKKNHFIPADGGMMLDIGANIGIISIGLVRAGQVRSAVAIEPEASNYKYLQKNVMQNELTNRFQMIHCALGQEDGHLLMQVSQNNFGDHRTAPINKKDTISNCHVIGHKIICHALDDFHSWPLTKEFREQPAFMWIDVQGYEGFVFLGGENFLKNSIPTIAELWPRGIKEAGMELGHFAQIVQSKWKLFWVLNKRKEFQGYSINLFDEYLYELDMNDASENIILTGALVKNQSND